MQPYPKNKGFWMAPFVVHATRGIIRDQTTRRWTMFSTLLLALLLSFLGGTLLRGMLFEHPAWLILFWFVVTWLTLTALLLAFLDLLVVRSQARAAKKILHAGVGSHTPSVPEGRGDG